MSRSARSWPSLARCGGGSERARRPASWSALSSGSSSLTAAATAEWRLTSRSFGSRSLVRLSMGASSRVPGPVGLETPLGDYRLDDGDRAVGPAERDLDAP